jgi:type I restriction-modification system DNA methylase subunit
MTSDPVSDLSYADTLWKSADALRGQVDAAEYKHVVLGLERLAAVIRSNLNRVIDG